LARTNKPAPAVSTETVGVDSTDA
ncbi:ribonuclease P protein component, partial [Pseudomonas cyclaminis]